MQNFYLSKYLVVLCFAVAILTNYCVVDCWEVWDRGNFGITVGSSKKMARDETNIYIDRLA